MTYGQTGSGKTFTMSGDSGNYQVPCHTVKNRVVLVVQTKQVHIENIVDFHFMIYYK